MTVTIRPPAYTNLPQSQQVNPSELRPIENSVLEFAIESGARSVEIEVNGDKRTIARDANRSLADRMTATRSGYVIVTADDGGRRLMPMTVIPDALPAVRIVAPGGDLVFSGGNRRLQFETQATDDFGLRSLRLRYTKGVRVRGRVCVHGG